MNMTNISDIAMKDYRMFSMIYLCTKSDKSYMENHVKHAYHLLTCFQAAKNLFGVWLIKFLLLPLDQFIFKEQLHF